MNRALHHLLLASLLLLGSHSESAALTLQPGDLVVVDTSGKTLVRIDLASGVREPFASWAGDAGKRMSYPWGIALAQDGRILLSDMNARAIFALAPETEQKAIVSGGNTGDGMNLAGVRGIALDGAGGLYAASTRRSGKNTAHLVFHVDLATGNRRPISADDVGRGPVLTFPAGIAVEADGRLLVNVRGASALYRIDPATGDRSVVSSDEVGSGPALDNPLGLAVLRNGDAVIADRKGSQIVYVDTKTGDRRVVASSEVGSGPEVKDPFALVQAPDGNLYASDVGTWSVYHVNLADGVRTLIASKEVGSGPPIEMPRGLLLISGIPGGGNAASASKAPLAIAVLVAAGAAVALAAARRRRVGAADRDGSRA
jgi:sugar lactone lactonase YvrE